MLIVTLLSVSDFNVIIYVYVYEVKQMPTGPWGPFVAQFAKKTCRVNGYGKVAAA